MWPVGDGVVSWEILYLVVWLKIRALNVYKFVNLPTLLGVANGKIRDSPRR